MSSFGIPPGDLEDFLVRHLLDDARSRIVVLVDPVAEAHQLAMAFLDALDECGNAVLRSDLVQHVQNLFVSAAMQRSGERGSGAGDRKVRIGLRAADAAHRVGAAILLMIRVQNEETIQRASQHRVGRYFGSTIFHIMFMKFSA